MLVLSRKAGEKITIGEGIVVTVSRISGGRVTLAIEAPENVRILRGELVPFSGVTTSGGTTLSNGTTISNGSHVEASVPVSHPTPKSTPGMSPMASSLPSAIARRTMLPPVHRSTSVSPNA